MRAVRARCDEGTASLDGAVIVADVRDALGRVLIGRGTRIGPDERAILEGARWEELHLVLPDDGELVEEEAGRRLAHASSGRGVWPGDAAGGHWPLTAERRGVLTIEREALQSINAAGPLAVYTLPDGQVVDAGEVVARVKVIPFVVDSALVEAAEAAAGSGVVAVHPFAPARLGAVVQESLGSSALDRFRRALDEKAAWFGSSVLEPCVVPRDVRAITTALGGLRQAGAEVIVVAGTMAMDPLDPAFEALTAAGGRLERVGVPAHPGSLLWLGRIDTVPVVGMPSCGLFSRATVFDLVLPRLLAGLRVDAAWLGSLGEGGLLTRDMAARFPPYRPRTERGAVE